MFNVCVYPTVLVLSGCVCSCLGMGLLPAVRDDVGLGSTLFPPSLFSFYRAGYLSLVDAGVENGAA